MKTISVIGGLSSKNAIEGSELGSYHLSSYVGFSSPMSLVSPPPAKFLKIIDIKDCAIWQKECVVNDFNKTAFDYLSKKKGDYLLIDLTEARLSLLQITDNKSNEAYVSYSKAIEKNVSNLFKGKFKACESALISCFSFDDIQWIDAIRGLAEKLLSLYDKEHIIVNKVFRVAKYISTQGTIKSFEESRETRDRFNNFYTKLYNWLIAFLGCNNVIEFPKYVLADENCKTGLFSMHYCENYYKYLRDALDIISSDNDNKTKDLHLLKLKYEKLFQETLSFSEANNSSAKIINVFGSNAGTCFLNFDTQKRYKVKTAIYYNSPLALIGTPFPVIIDEEKLSLKTTLQKSCLACDFNKSVFNKLSMSKSHYLLLDVMEARLQIFNITFKDGSETYLTYSNLFQQCYAEIFGDELQDCSTMIMDITKFSDETLELIVKQMAHNILNIYTKNQIILNEMGRAERYITKEGKLSYFTDPVAKKFNPFFEKIYELLEKYLDGCHIIKFPYNTFADENHKWGLSPLGYCDDYYSYVLEAMSIITNAGDNKEEALSVLLNNYVDSFKAKINILS